MSDYEIEDSINSTNNESLDFIAETDDEQSKSNQEISRKSESDESDSGKFNKIE